MSLYCLNTVLFIFILDRRSSKRTIVKTIKDPNARVIYVNGSVLGVEKRPLKEE